MYDKEKQQVVAFQKVEAKCWRFCYKNHDNYLIWKCSRGRFIFSSIEEVSIGWFVSRITQKQRHFLETSMEDGS